MVKSIFNATVFECPKELEQQAHDMDGIINICNDYMKKYNVNINDIIHDLSCVLEV